MPFKPFQQLGKIFITINITIIDSTSISTQRQSSTTGGQMIVE